LASSSDDSTVRLWNIETGETVRQYLGHKGLVDALAISRDGKFMATGSADRTSQFWEIFPEPEPRVIRGEGVFDATLSPDGSVIAGSFGRVLRLYNASTGEPIRELAP